MASRRQQFREQIENIEGFAEYLRLFRLLPRPIRIVGYTVILTMLPFYLGLTPRLAQDLFTEPLENMEIRLGWRLPHPWNGRFATGRGDVAASFTPARWDGASADAFVNEPDNESLMIHAGTPVYWNLRSNIFSLYDFYARFDFEVVEEQTELSWVVRTDRSGDNDYRFRLGWEGERWSFSGIQNEDGDEIPLFVIPNVLELNPLRPGDRLNVLLNASGCIFDHRFRVDRADLDFEQMIDLDIDFDNEGFGETFAATGFAEQPCIEYGDFGLISPGHSTATKLIGMEICSHENLEMMEVFCGDFKTYFDYFPEPKEEEEEEF